MKKSDLIVVLCVLAFFLPFFIIKEIYRFYYNTNIAHPYLMSFIKFAILATFGEALGLRIREGIYNKPGFGLLPKALVWGFLGLTVKITFVIFGAGAPILLNSFGLNIAEDILKHPEFSFPKFLTAFTVGASLNFFYAPILMTAHKVTDEHIARTGGSLKGLFSKINISNILSQNDWKVFWNFVFRKTILLFWIPAQTINFLLPEEFRVLVAAFYSVILGVFLAIASLKGKDQPIGNIST
jgi:hypothetical protein